jgi:ribose transport system ATP-binding protein
MPADPPSPAATPADNVLEVAGVSKRFPGVRALSDVSLAVRAGEVHALFGENGAGKSTLVNVIVGTYSPDEGSVRVRGEALQRFTPEESRQRGISAVFQDLSLVPSMTVAENLYLGREPGKAGFINRRASASDALGAIRALDGDIVPGARVDSLSRAQQQLVEIAKALLGDPAVLILDEPTTTLTEREVDKLFALVGELTRRGIGIIYITHRMKEIWRIADRITVLRDGEWMATRDVGDVDDQQLVELMTGRTVERLYPTVRRSPAQRLLELDGVRGGDLSDATLEVHAGEIVGVAGLVGSGKSDIGRLCFGLESPTAGAIRLAGEDVTRGSSPTAMLRRGMVYYPADRRADGLIPMASVRENILLSALGQPTLSWRGLMRRRAQRRRADEAIRRLRIQPPDPNRAVELLSGGNQQKVVLARALMRDARVHIFDEPTAGVDVGARVEVYEFIKELCEAGCAVLLISSDLPEVVNLAHRVYVVHAGRVRTHLEGEGITEENVVASFFDARDEAPPLEVPA